MATRASWSGYLKVSLLSVLGMFLGAYLYKQM